MQFSSPKENFHDLHTVIKEVVIKNRHGLHARPAALFVKTAQQFQAEISVEKEGELVNGKSIMGLMMLAAAKDSRLRLLAQGKEADAALTALEELINHGFGEEL